MKKKAGKGITSWLSMRYLSSGETACAAFSLPVDSLGQTAATTPTHEHTRLGLLNQNHPH